MSFKLDKKAASARVEQPPVPLRNYFRDICQPDHVLVHSLATCKAEPRSGAGKVGRTGPKHDRVKVDAIFIDQPEVGQASCQMRSSNFNLSINLGLEPLDHPLRSLLTSVALGPTVSKLRETTHLGECRQASAKSRSSGPQSAWSSSQ